MPGEVSVKFVSKFIVSLVEPHFTVMKFEWCFSRPLKIMEIGQYKILGHEGMMEF